MWRRIFFIILLVALVLAVLGSVLIAFSLTGAEPAAPAGLPGQPTQPAGATPTASTPAPAQIERGRYLARAGNCAGCHTTRGGAPYAGGLAMNTPFGTLHTSNLTPDATHGLGNWSAADFWRAMHEGRSRSGRLLYPAFPYPNFTQVTRDDSDALFAFLRSLPPAAVPNAPHRLRFPYNTQAALAVWRWFSFKPGAFVTRSDQSAEWNRGAYLVDGLGHCIACHGSRNRLGATETERGLSGGLIPVENWYAPSLASPREAGVADWPIDDIVALLQSGRSPRGSVHGPMAAVVFQSTQHLSEADLTAMAHYLQRLPAAPAGAAPAPAANAPIPRDERTMARGNRIFDQRCAYCHGEVGQGAQDAYPPLAGNRAVTMTQPLNLIQMVRHGGFLPATRGNPRPYGMPAFGHLLDDEEIAAVLTYIRGSWGNDAAPVTARDLQRR